MFCDCFQCQPRSHRLGACRTCRRRHVKCDQKRPSCRTCRSYGIPCEGFTNKIRWMQDDTAADNTDTRRSTRRHLYTERTRLSMGSALGSGLVSGSIDASLGEIDSRTRDFDSPGGDIVIGPFAVLRLDPNVTRSTRYAQSSVPAVTDNPVLGSEFEQSPSLPSALPSELVAGELPTREFSPTMIDSLYDVDDFLQWPDLLDCDISQTNPFLSFGGALDVQPGSDPGSVDPQVENRTLSSASISLPGGSEKRHIDQTVAPHQHANEMASALLEAAVLTDAPHLLKNFNDRVIPLTIPIPIDEKSPLKILNMPSAMVTYGDLTILGGDKISHARQANLYALLACSAYHLSLEGNGDFTDLSEYWNGVSKQMAQRGLEHMQLSLKLEMHEPRRAKYKDQLMAICCLTEYAVG